MFICLRRYGLDLAAIIWQNEHIKRVIGLQSTRTMVYMLGRVARSTRGSLILGYFFVKTFTDVPTIEDTVGLGPYDAFLVKPVHWPPSELEPWVVLGNGGHWDRSQWPNPPFGSSLSRAVG